MATDRHTLSNSAEPLAIVGLSFKLPQDAVDETSFWEVMEKRKNLSTDWPTDRTCPDGFYQDGPKEPNMLPARGIHAVNQDPAVFDAPFFSITAKEASSMDPQQRWALEAAYHAFENAGIATESLRSSRTAVFSATFADDFTRIMAKDPDAAPLQAAMGTTPSILPNRISWYFNLRGPSMHIDTACSGSMVAMDLACQSIKSGNSTAALVIGINVMLSPENSVLLGNMNFLSPDGRSFSFDERANGYARGEGVLAVVIKPLTDALNNGDVIRAVVRSTASNHDGRTPILTQPSAEAQEALIRDAYRKAGLGFEHTRYVEAHASRGPNRNVSDWECIPLIPIPSRAPFCIPTRSIPWPTDGLRRISVNSFGVGGANAHIILDDAFHYLQEHGLSGFHHCDTPTGHAHGTVTNGTVTNGTATNGHVVNGASANRALDERSIPRLLIWSAADAGATDRMLQAYQSYYQAHIIDNHRKLNQLAYTLATRRSVMPWRAFAVVDGADGIKPTVPVRASSEKASIGFIFTGQGAQYAGMGLELLQYPVFESSLRESDQIFASLGAEWSIQDALRREKDIHLPQFSQPLCTALQIALVDLLRSFGVSPAAVVGHSSGEIAAAYTIGALSQRSACKVAYFRGQLAGKLAATTATPGAMMSANLVEPEIPSLLEKLGLSNGDSAVHVACVNSPTNVTLSGPVNSIRVFQSYLDQQGIFAKTVPTGVAYHSPAMRAIATEYRALLGDLESGKALGVTELQSPASVMVSSVTGNTVAAKLLSIPDYWVDNLVSPVRFADAVQRLTGQAPSLPLAPGTGGIKDLVEIGPHPALRRPLKDTVPSLRHHAILERSRPDVQTVLSVIGSLFCYGYSLSVTAANSQASGKLPWLIDCPPYPFDHSRRYWSESRIARDYRQRKPAPGYLLGRRAQDWNELRPRWRNWLSIETHPWLGDHCVDGVAVCPGTGMVVMAIEAVQQMATDEDRAIAAYVVKEAQFLSPIVIGESSQESTETELHVLPTRNGQDKDITWYETRIFSYRDNGWTECFHASIRVQYEPKSTDAVDGGREQRQAHDRVRQRVKDAASACNKTLRPDSFYSFNQENIGLHFKSSFQNLSRLEWDGHGTFSARVDIASASQHYRILNSPVHPAVLDSCIQPNLAQISRGLSRTTCPTMMAHSVANMWISAKVWDKATDSVHLGSFTKDLSDKTGQFEASAYGTADDGSPLFSVEKIVMAEVSRPGASMAEQAGKSLYQIAWKPQLSSLHGKALQQYFDAADSGAVDEATLATLVPKMEFAMRTAARKALREVMPAERQRAPAHMQKYAALLEQRYNSGDEDDLTSEELDHRLADNAAEKFYGYLSRTYVRDRRLFEFIGLAAHERPALRIIEVGAGTGAMTRPVMASLRDFEEKMGRACFYEFMYTDISPAFFEAARAEFAEFEGRMFFKTLDLERDAGSQGFELGSYDMVIATNVFHATSNLEQTLNNARKLLRPGGRLVFQEGVVPNSACFNVGFGCLEGWLLGTEEWRQQGPLATEKQWDEVLRATGFSGIDASLWDYPSEACHMCSTIFSEAIPPASDSSIDAQNEAKTWLLTDPDSQIQQSLTSELGHSIQLTEVIHLTDVSNSDWVASPKDVVISLLEVDSPLLASVSEADFAGLKALFAPTENLLWVTAPQNDADPHYALALGFLRTMRSEEGGKHIVTLAFQSSITGDDAVRFVSELRQRCFAEQSPCSEEEFIVCEDQLTIGRLERAVDLQNEQLARIHPQEREEPWRPGPRLALDVGTPGLLDTIRFIEDTTPPKLGADEVEIEAAAWGVGFRDILIALGRLSADEEIGLECAGTVVRVGANCSDFQAGDRVLTTVPGCMRSHPRASAHLVYRMPERLSFSEAVAVLIPGMTAYHSLVNVARVCPGDKVLIHAAAGATGQMMVAIAQMLGAEVFATVGSGEKKDLLIKRFKILTDHIFYSRNTSFAPGVMRVTGGYGVDVVVNSLSGESLRASWECVAPYGHFIEIGKADIRANSSLPMSGFAKNVSFTAVDVLHIAQTDHRLTRQLAEKAIDLVAGGDISGPTPLQLFGASRVEQAFRLMQSGTNIGRIVITLSPEEIVPKYTTLKSTWTFGPDASYLVAGGLGGIGKAILGWMVDKGARHLIVPSRSGASSQQAAEFLAELAGRGVQVVAPCCDVSSATDLAAILQEYATTMPPIRGCINAAMVLHDAIFENMTHSQWSLNIQSKVHTSWNLHQLLPKDMDFFILLSSVMGIYANPSQSNYAAGCVFQDTLARSRSAQGLRGSVSFDIGYMRSVGYVAQRSADSQVIRANARKLVPIETEEFLEILDHYCDPALPPLDETHSQLLIGARTAGDYTACGEEPVPATLRPLFAGFNNSRHQDARRARADLAEEANPSLLFQQADSAEERHAVVTVALRAKVARALGVTVEDVDAEKTLADYGTDSLMAVELRSWMRKDFAADVTVFDMMGGKSIKAVGELVVEKAGA
ncbi:hypothetical protein N431DRAFT_553644 [Stipitochalara longipes BDJ]|nr:hypothetical protein N431DRAFT_553644 [Stipitochalara longipes BDJ]